VSIGDQTHEHEACRAAVAAPCVVKAVKLVEKPSLADLAAQLRLVYNWLENIAAYGGGLNLDLENAASLAAFSEVVEAQGRGPSGAHRSYTVA
jgi:hypothetical protein